MIKTYKFTTKKNNNTTFIPFNTISYEPNYSEIIDNIILVLHMNSSNLSPV